jgi:4-hydroxy-4-methyl-2-oxoglutarate aldolase
VAGAQQGPGLGSLNRLMELDMHQLQGLRTGHFSDAMDDLGIRGGAASGVNYLGPPGVTAIGPAFTLRQAIVEHEQRTTKPVTRHADAARELAAPGDVLVIDVGGHTGISTWGEAQTLRAMARGLAGVLLHGATRDAPGIRLRQFPIGCFGFSPRRSSGRLETVALNEPVEMAGVVIRPGDLVAFDEDGLVCVAAENIDAVVAQARVIANREVQRDRELESKLKA